MTVVSDIDGDSTEMDTPHVEILIHADAADLNTEQSLQLMQLAGIEQQPDDVVGKLFKGKDATDLAEPISFAVPIGAGLTALRELGIVEIDDGRMEDTDTDD